MAYTHIHTLHSLNEKLRGEVRYSVAITMPQFVTEVIHTLEKQQHTEDTNTLGKE